MDLEEALVTGEGVGLANLGCEGEGLLADAFAVEGARYVLGLLVSLRGEDRSGWGREDGAEKGEEAWPF